MATPNDQPREDGHRRLRRLSEGRLLGGVASGFAHYFDIDVALVRMGFVALCLFGGMAIPLYLAGWLFIPQEGTDATVAGAILKTTSIPRRGAWTA
jgi:phage shock protein PspC (stress-responsive transcriptional regulator)